jgi:hypothetical protein
VFSLTVAYEQLSFEEQISKVGALPNRNPEKFIELLETHFDLPTFIPRSFYHAYYNSQTNDRDYSLESMLSVLLLMHFFHYASVPNFIVLLTFSPKIREFCRLPEGKIPDESCISKFKTAFDKELNALFDNMALHVMNIFTQYNESLPEDSPKKGLNEEAVYDTTGLKPKVKENNPKTISSEIRKQSKYKDYLLNKGDARVKTFNVYEAAYSNLPKTASANPAIKLDYANGHFGYFYKFGIISNGFGVPLHIHFLDDDFYKYLPDKFDSPEHQKYTFDNASLCPVFSSFKNNIGNNRFTTFLGDSEFDSFDNYSFLNEFGFSKVVIPINARNSKPQSGGKIPLSDEGIPTCPKNDLANFKAAGYANGKNRSFRLKYVCPKSKYVKGKAISFCDDMCRQTNSAVTTYIYPNGDLRVFSGVQRGSDEWRRLYKRRSVIERSIASLKSHPAIALPKTFNSASLRSDVFLNASSKLITVILAFALGHVNFLANLRNLLRVAYFLALELEIAYTIMVPDNVLM